MADLWRGERHARLPHLGPVPHRHGHAGRLPAGQSHRDSGRPGPAGPGPRRERVVTTLRAGLGAAVVLVGLTACSSSDDEATPTGSASPSASSSASSTATGSPSGSATASASPSGSDEPSPTDTAPPTPAGTSEAEAVASLPTGRATGNTVLTYSGVGELRQPFEGECSQEGDTTRINGAADTAVIQIRIAPDGARLELQIG